MKSALWKKLVALAISAILIMTLFVACGEVEKPEQDAGAKQEQNKAAEPRQKEEVTLSLLMIQSRVYPGLEKMIAKLEEEENIKMDMQVVPDDQYSNVLQMKINSGEAPDLIDLNTNSFADLNPDENLYDLSNEVWVDRLITPAIATYNDKIYAFPFQDRNGIGSMIYNVDLFEEHGVSIPTNEEEFYAVCEVFKGKGITPVLEASDLWVPQMWINYEFPKALGGEEELKAFGEAIVTHKKEVTDYPELAEVIDTYLDMYKMDYVNEDYLTSPYDQMLERLGKGEGAMLYGFSAVLGGLESKFPDVNFGTFNLIVDAQEEDLLASPFFSIALVVPKTTEKFDTIQRVFDLWSTPEYCDMWFEENMGFPAFEGVYGGEQNESQMTLYEKYVGEDKLVSELYTYIPELSPIHGTSLWLYLADAPGKGMTGMEVLQKWQDDINVFMKEQQAPGF